MVQANNERIIAKELIEWDTADHTIAMISSSRGSMISARGIGRTELIIKFEGITLRIPITVAPNEPIRLSDPQPLQPEVIGLITDPASVRLKVGDSRKIRASVQQDDSTNSPVEVTLKYSSSNSEVVKVFQATSQVEVVASESRDYQFPTSPTPNKPFVINESLVDLDAVGQVLASGDNNPPASFTDPLPPWGSEYIDRATRMGIVSGYDDNTFRANKVITRAEFAKMVSIAFGLESKEGSGIKKRL